MSEAIEQLLPRPSVMGVVNVTPDSFSDGGAFLHPQAAIAAARGMIEEGAAIVDIGAESTRPGSEGVPLDEELRRVEPVLEALFDVRVSIDTSKAEVARRALDAGAVLINDVTSLRGDPELAGEGPVLVSIRPFPNRIQRRQTIEIPHPQRARDFLLTHAENVRRAWAPTSSAVQASP